MTTTKIKASELREGHSIPALDNFYVVEVEDNFDLGTGRFNVRVGEGLLFITGHDAEGEENYLLLSPESTVEVSE